jgi:hypothetical protein
MLAPFIKLKLLQTEVLGINENRILASSLGELVSIFGTLERIITKRYC